MIFKRDLMHPAVRLRREQEDVGLLQYQRTVGAPGPVNGVLAHRAIGAGVGAVEQRLVAGSECASRS